VPAVNPVIVLLAPVPDIEPGLMVQLPAGKPFNTTLPVETKHVGWVTVPTNGVSGVSGWSLITTFTDAVDTHPEPLVTIKLYVPGSNPDMVVIGPVPVIPPGYIVQVPAGSPPSTTLPVATEQDGCVIESISGGSEFPGLGRITTSTVVDVHPAEFVTEKE